MLDALGRRDSQLSAPHTDPTMAAPRILVKNADLDRSLRVLRSGDTEAVWPLLGLIGLAFTVIGAVDIALAWYPSALGSAEWEFGTIGATLNGLPLPALGLFL